MKIVAIILALACCAVACGPQPGPPPEPTAVPPVPTIQPAEPTPVPPVPTQATNPNPCKFTGSVGKDGAIWKGDCEVTEVCKRSADGSQFFGSCHTRPMP